MNKLVMYSIGMVGLAAVGFAVAPNLAGAQSTSNPVGRGNGKGSGYQQMIQTKASLFGMTDDELKTQLETKTMLEIAKEKGISEEQFHQAMETAARKRWAEKGLNETEIAERLERMKQRQAGDHETNSMNRGGMGRGRFHQ